jgi:hypothetical protein
MAGFNQGLTSMGKDKYDNITEKHKVVPETCRFLGLSLRHEADHSPPSCAEVKNDEAVPPFPHTHS